MKKSYTLQTCITIFAIVISSITMAQNLNWNISPGGNASRSGLSDALGPLVLPGGEPELFWEGGENAAVAHSPIIFGDNLIVNRRFPNNSSQESWIINYNVYTGEERWRIQLPIDTYHNFSQINGVNNGMVYANRAGGASQPEIIYALDIETGEIIWQSEDPAGICASESVSFADNGDLIVADLYYIWRINYLDGTNIWKTSRGGASSDGDAPNVYGNRVYIWDQTSMGMFIATLDIETGEELYESEIFGSPGFQQQGFTISDNGIIYANIERNVEEMDSLHAFTDDGTEFEHLWSYPTTYTTYGNIAVGPDGSVYAYSRDSKLVRLDPETGLVLNTSEISLELDGDPGMDVYTAIGADGIVYTAVEDWPEYKLSFFTPECELMWSEEIYGLRGIALADSVLVINGKNDIIRAYKGRSHNWLTTTDITKRNSNIVYPNPSSTGIFYLDLEKNSKEIPVIIYSVDGKEVLKIIVSANQNSSVKIDLSEQKNGLYLVRYFANDVNYFIKMIKQ